MNRLFTLSLGECIAQLEGLGLPEANRLAEELYTAENLPFQRPLPYQGDSRESSFFDEDASNDFRSIMARYTTSIEANRSNLLSTYSGYLAAIGTLDFPGHAEELAKAIANVMATLKADEAVAAYAKWLRGRREDEKKLAESHKTGGIQALLDITLSLEEYREWVNSGQAAA